MRRQVYSLLVDNNPGVLSRIAGLFSRRGYSIDSITAGMTADPRFTRITVVSSGDELILSQIEKQVRKLEDVREIKLLKDDEAVYRGDHGEGSGECTAEDGSYFACRYFPGEDRGRGKRVPDDRTDREPVQAGSIFEPAGRI